MSTKPLISLAVLVVCFLASMQRVHAMGAMFCTIKVDDIEVLYGTIFHPPEASKFEILKIIGFADISPSGGSPYSKSFEQDLQLQGHIEISVEGFPTLRLDSLRLACAPGQQHVGPQWLIHHEDARQINAFYGPIADRMQREQQRNEQIKIALQWWWPTVVITGAALIAVVALISFAYYIYRSFRASRKVPSSV